MVITYDELRKAFEKAKKTYESTTTADDIWEEVVKARERAKKSPKKPYLMQTKKVDWDAARKMRARYMKIKDIAAFFKVNKETISVGFTKRGIK